MHNTSKADRTSDLIDSFLGSIPTDAEEKEAKKEKAQEDFMSQVKEKMAEMTGAKEMLDENGNPIDEGADKYKCGKDKGG